MANLKFLTFIVFVGFLLNNNPVISMRIWDYHKDLINEYDNCTPPATANKNFDKFSECILDNTWKSRNIHGENDSVRFEGNPPLIFDFLKASYSSVGKKLVMDLAGADGRVAELALFTGARVLLIDKNYNEIEEANKRIKEKRKLPKEFVARFQSYSVDALQMDENSQLKGFIDQIDCIHMSNLLHFFDMQQTDKLLDNIKFFLKKGGKVYGEVDSIYANASNVEEFASRLKDSTILHPGIFSIGHRIHNYYSVESLQILLERFGFSPVNIYYSDGTSYKLPADCFSKSVKVVFSFEKK